MAPNVLLITSSTSVYPSAPIYCTLSTKMDTPTPIRMLFHSLIHAHEKPNGIKSRILSTISCHIRFFSSQKGPLKIRIAPKSLVKSVK